MQAIFDPGISEWGNLVRVISDHPPLNQIGGEGLTRRSEPSQYPQEKKASAIPLVAASERGTAQTSWMLKLLRVVQLGLREQAVLAGQDKELQTDMLAE